MNTFIPNTNIPLDPPPLDDTDHYVVRSGPLKSVVVTVKTIQPLLLNKVLRSVKLPKRPTYETETVTGAKQLHPLDKESAAETPGGKAQWEYYEEMLQEAQGEQNDRMTTAIFAMGSDFDIDSIPEDAKSWEAEHALLGIEVPQELRLKKAHLLSTSLGSDEISALTTKIMKKSGVDEEAVKEAEDSFRDALRDRSPEAGNVVDVRPNQGANSQQQLEIQRSL